MSSGMQLFYEAISLQNAFTVWQIFIVMGLGAALSVVITKAYRYSHRGTTYSQSFTHTIFMMTVVVGIIMLLIGGNLARAFTLVGALSVIRFRTAIKDAKDTGFIFLAMGVGMACGTQFYLVAVLLTFFVSGLMVFLVKIDYGAKETVEQILTVRFDANLDGTTELLPVFDKYFDIHNLLSRETLRAGTLVEVVYSVSLRPGTNEQEFIRDVQAAVGTEKVRLVQRDQRVDI